MQSTPQRSAARSIRPLLVIGALAFGALAAGPAPGGAVVIDSFTDPLPENPLLPASAARVLFLGPRCDGAACPPATVVQGPEFYTRVDQFGLGGILGPVRATAFATYFEPNPGASGFLTIEGGALAGSGTDNPTLAVGLEYGDLSSPLHFDLRSDGSDRFEIEILAAPTSPFGVGQVLVSLRPENYGQLGAPSAGGTAVVYGPGLVVLPFASLGSRLAEFEHDVAVLAFQVSGIAGITIGEIRTATTPTPAAASSWGRVKAAYRR